MFSNNIYIKHFNEKYSDICLLEYFLFIDSVKVDIPIKHQIQKHHILPKWAFPEFSDFRKNPWNLALLKHTDHIYAHILLAKLWPVMENILSAIRMGSADSVRDTDISLAYARRTERVRELIEKGLHNFQQESHIAKVSELSRLNYYSGKSGISPDFIFQKYGVKNIMNIETIKQRAQSKKTLTLYDRYGITHNWQISESREKITAKSKETYLKNYGVDHPNKTKSSKIRLSNWMLENNPMKDPEYAAKQKETCKILYGHENPMSNPDVARKSVATRMENEKLKSKKYWIKHPVLKVTAIVRLGSEEESKSLLRGFVKGRGIIGFTSLTSEDLASYLNSKEQ